MQTLDRATKFEKKCRELAEESKRNIEAARQEHAAMKADRDAWRARCRDAKCKAGDEAGRSEFAEAKLAVVTRSLELDRERVNVLSERLQTAEEQVGLAESRAWVADERADTAWSQAQVTGIRAEEAGKRAQEAEKQAGQADELNKGLSWVVKEASGRATKAEEKAQKADAARLLIAAQLWDADVRLEEAECRAWRAEAEAKGDAEKAKTMFDNFIHSPAIERELVEAAFDAYLQGFEDCKVKMTFAYSLEDIEAIRPKDPDADADKEVGSADGEEAGDAPSS